MIICDMPGYGFALMHEKDKQRCETLVGFTGLPQAYTQLVSTLVFSDYSLYSAQGPFLEGAPRALYSLGLLYDFKRVASVHPSRCAVRLQICRHGFLQSSTYAHAADSRRAVSDIK
jgi:hypothetical protein